MRILITRISLALTAICAVAASGGPTVRAQRAEPSIALPDVADGQLVDPARRIYAALPPGSSGAEFTFLPEARGDVYVPPIVLGRDTGHLEPSYGPDCAGPCEKTVFSVDPAIGLAHQREGWGRLTVRDLGSGDTAEARVYWDPTPPVSTFETPVFNQRVSVHRQYEVVTHTLDEDVTSVKVWWALAPLAGRNIPRFEQHYLGYDFAGHAACVPTSAGAAMAWLERTFQTNILDAPFDTDDKALVETLGALMHTDNGGTSGSDLRNGWRAFLLGTKGWLDGQDYDLYSFTPDTQHPGITPEQLFATFHVFGGTAIVGVHNFSEDPTFGHVLVLANITLNSDGSGRVTLMDPHVEQPWPSDDPIEEGVFRTFTLDQFGRLQWTAAAPGYYEPSSGMVKLNELVVLTHYPSILQPGLATPLSGAPTTGWVDGSLTPGNRTFVGTFTPPADSPGPWILVSETTHRAGHTMQSYRVVGVQ